MSLLSIHTLFEAVGYAVGFRLFLRARRSAPTSALADTDDALWVVVGAVLGAAIGSKLSYWINQPDVAFADFPNLARLIAGKSIVGGLLGGWLGVECAKRGRGIRSSTGDSMVLPLAVGMAVGRVGCLLSGLHDQTHGLPTGSGWGWDYGDGIPRHPVQLYEIAWLTLSVLLIHRLRGRLPRAGDAFKLFLGGYLLFRLLVDFLKPVLFAYPGGSAGLQWLAFAGLLYYGPHIYRIGRDLR